MAELLLSGLSDETMRRLECRAEAHGRSVEAEGLAILEEAARQPLTGAEFVALWQNGPLSEIDDSIWQEIIESRNGYGPREP